MLYPDALIPNGFEDFDLDDQIVRIPKCALELVKWEGDSIEHTFGNKPLLNFYGKPMFAELLVANIFLSEEWNSRWIETYGRAKLNPIYLTSWLDKAFKEQIHVPIKLSRIDKLLSSIERANENSYSGCWDVLSWQREHVLFCETKRKDADKIRSSQKKWLKSALQNGLSPANFLLIEWDFK